jgi:hypothetical protein
MISLGVTRISSSMNWVTKGIDTDSVRGGHLEGGRYLLDHLGRPGPRRHTAVTDQADRLDFHSTCRKSMAFSSGALNPVCS